MTPTTSPTQLAPMHATRDASRLIELLRSELPRPSARSKRGPDPAGGPDAIVAEGLGKRYPNGIEAVRGISLRVRTGEIYGVLGPNGAGKSTTIGILGTLLRPTSGRAAVAGFDVVAAAKDARRNIGFAMQEVGLDELATGRELLVLQGRLHGLSRGEAARRADLLVELVDLESAANERIGGYSGGMKRRVDLASALIHLPPVLFLDEPTEGLDPRARSAIWETLKQLNASLEVTVLMTTHYMAEAERLCDRIGIIDRGLIVVEGTPAELKAAAGGPSATLEDVYLRFTGRGLAKEEILIAEMTANGRQAA
jgi:ABC-2 type transport system ATP-binding protein